MVGGGDGHIEQAVSSAKIILRILRAAVKEENTVFSLHTDVLAAKDDAAAVKKINEIARGLNAAAHKG